MENITENEMAFVLRLLKSPELAYNANNIAKNLGISPMGALKIARRLGKEDIIKSKELGKAKFYSLNLKSDYVRQYVKFLLQREANHAKPYVKVWLSEVRKIKSADAGILFGSILTKQKLANDIDVLLITDKKRFSKLEDEIKDINLLNVKRLHPIYQTREDVRNNIKKGDKPLLNAIKGIVAFGEELMIELLEK